MAPENTCPLMSIGDETDYNPCITDRCAWFHIVEDPENGSANGECAILDIAEALRKKAVQDATNIPDGKGTPQNN